MSIEAFVRIRENGQADSLEPLYLGPSFFIVQVRDFYYVRAKMEWIADLMDAGARSVERRERRLDFSLLAGVFFIGASFGMVFWEVFR